MLMEIESKIMEYLAIERDALNLVSETISGLTEAVEEVFEAEESCLQSTWIENLELAKHLGLSLRTLQSYRERGIIGYSLMGRKIYYRRSEINELLKSGRLSKTEI